MSVRRHVTISIALSAAIMYSLLGSAAIAQVYKDPNAPIEDRVEDLLGRMTIEEKIAQLSGEGGNAMTTLDNERLGIPGFSMADGPYGVRRGQATCFPTGTAMGATWDPELVQRMGAAMGQEFRAKGCYVALGPCINIIRDPRGGRSFETMAEDPYLLGQLAAAIVRGIQSQKVVAVAKHYVCNNQENNRGQTDAQVGERTMREFYMPAFKACVEQADLMGVMSAYNRCNGTYCSANDHILRDVLKGEWGFRGFVVSDWGACHSTYASINGGLDVEMPFGPHFAAPLLAAAKAGEVKTAVIDEAVRRALRAKFWAGVFENPVQPDDSLVNTPEHQQLVRQAAGKAIVLLKNENDILPLDRDQIDSIAVIGPNADAERHAGGGSSHVSPFYSVTPLQGIENKVGEDVEVEYVQGVSITGTIGLDPIPVSALKPPAGTPGDQGVRGQYFTNMTLTGEPSLVRTDEGVDFNWGGGGPAEEIGSDAFSVRWDAQLTPPQTGEYFLGTTTDDGARLYLDGRRIIDDWQDHGVESTTVRTRLEAGRTYNIRMEYYENSGEAVAQLVWQKPTEMGEAFAGARTAAADADIAILALGTAPRLESEGHDRESLALPSGQDELARAILEANPNTIVLFVSGSAVAPGDWIDGAPAALQCWFAGQEAGNAIADVLFGDVNPGGKLPLTFPRSTDDLPPWDHVYETIGEGRGYRYYDRNNIEPLFAFGHGLSYTTFDYSNLQIEPATIAEDEEVTVSIDVENTGDRAGDEIVQLYVADPECSLPRPLTALKGFRRITLQPGETQTVQFTLGAEHLSFYDVNAAEWIVEPGEFIVAVAKSSRDIQATGSFQVR